MPRPCAYHALRRPFTAGKPVWNIEYDPEAFKAACRSENPNGPPIRSIFKVCTPTGWMPTARLRRLLCIRFDRGVGGAVFGAAGWLI
jgi:hypothetical protein